MTWQLVWTRPALRDMKKLGEERAGRVRQAMIRLIETGHGDIAKLRDTEPPEWWLRVGESESLLSL